MPVSNLTLMRATAVFTAIGMLILLAMVALSYAILERTRQSTEEVFATREMRSSLVDLLSVLQDAETGQRGYLLTGEDRYLAPYDEAVRLTDERFGKLQEVFHRLNESDGFIADMRSAIDNKLAELSKTVALRKAGKVDEAMALVRSDAGKDAMDHVRAIIGGKRDEVEARLNTAIVSQRENTSILQLSIIGGGILIVLAGAGAAWALTSYTRELVKARSEVEGLNAGLELRVRERTADLQRANDEIQRFAYIVSHDLRAPLVNVMGFTAELKTSLESLQALANDPAVDSLPAAAAARTAADTDVPEAISFIQTSTRKMDSLINAILKLSREGRRSINPEPVNLALLFEGIGANIQHQLNDAKGELVVEKPLPTIVSDRLALEQVFGNLVDNAVKYQAPGRPPRVVIRSKSERDGSVLIEVEDNGRGIAEQDHDRVFDLFRRAGPQDKPGEGMGLAHVRALVRRLGGQITLISEPGIGSNFQVRLPRNVRSTMELSGELRG